MSKKVINQNTNYDSELLNSIESDFVFDKNPINRLENTVNNPTKRNDTDKERKLNELKLEINSIIDCDLKDNSKRIVLGDGNINSPIMLVGEASPTNIIGLLIFPSPKTILFELSFKSQSIMEFISSFNSLSFLSLSVSFLFVGLLTVFSNLLIGFLSKTKSDSIEFNSSES